MCQGVTVRSGTAAGQGGPGRESVVVMVIVIATGTAVAAPWIESECRVAGTGVLRLWEVQAAVNATD